MALILAFRNISGLADISDYEVDVYINDRLISSPPIVRGHRRSDGWESLVRRLVTPCRPGHHIDAPIWDGATHTHQLCPACGEIFIP